MTGSPISDLNPIFMVANCTLEVGSCGKLKINYIITLSNLSRVIFLNPTQMLDPDL
jgi:hypothetical protein